LPALIEVLTLTESVVGAVAEDGVTVSQDAFEETVAVMGAGVEAVTVMGCAAGCWSPMV
jgi:hypothetical protein